MRKRLWRILAALALLAMPARAQDSYPADVVTIIVPFAAGGPTDTVARLVARGMSPFLGQQVIVENVGGAGGAIGVTRVAKASADGYTLLLHHVGMAAAVALDRKLQYDPQSDFEPIGLVTDVPMTLVGRKNFPPETLEQLIAYIKAHKADVTYAHAGIGAASHLCGILFQTAIETPLTTVSYKGTGPAMNDLVGGQVDLLCDQTTNTTNQIRSHKIKAYAVTPSTRVPTLPNVPTMREAGLPGFELVIWHGLYAPKGTPPAIVAKLSAALQSALEDKMVIERLAGLGTAPVARDRATPDALRAVLTAEIGRWKSIVEAARAYAE